MTMLRRTQMPPPSKPLAARSEKKRAELAQAGNTSPFSTLARSTRKAAMRAVVASARRRPKSTGPSAAVVLQVVDRDDNCCVRCGHSVTGDRGVGWSVHHRVLRSHGVDNSPANLILLCGSGTTGCHGWVHTNPAQARRDGGWILRSTDKPASYPVVHRLLGVVVLDGDGGWSQSRPKGVAA